MVKIILSFLLSSLAMAQGVPEVRFTAPGDPSPSSDSITASSSKEQSPGVASNSSNNNCTGEGHKGAANEIIPLQALEKIVLERPLFDFDSTLNRISNVKPIKIPKSCVNRYDFSFKVTTQIDINDRQIASASYRVNFKQTDTDHAQNESAVISFINCINNNKDETWEKVSVNAPQGDQRFLNDQNSMVINYEEPWSGVRPNPNYEGHCRKYYTMADGEGNVLEYLTAKDQKILKLQELCRDRKNKLTELIGAIVEIENQDEYKDIQKILIAALKDSIKDLDYDELKNLLESDDLKMPENVMAEIYKVMPDKIKNKMERLVSSFGDVKQSHSAFQEYRRNNLKDLKDILDDFKKYVLEPKVEEIKNVGDGDEARTEVEKIAKQLEDYLDDIGLDKKIVQGLDYHGEIATGTKVAELIFSVEALVGRNLDKLLAGDLSLSGYLNNADKSYKDKVKKQRNRSYLAKAKDDYEIREARWKVSTGEDLTAMNPYILRDRRIRYAMERSPRRYQQFKIQAFQQLQEECRPNWWGSVPRSCYRHQQNYMRQWGDYNFNLGHFAGREGQRAGFAMNRMQRDYGRSQQYVGDFDRVLAMGRRAVASEHGFSSWEEYNGAYGYDDYGDPWSGNNYYMYGDLPLDDYQSNNDIWSRMSRT